MDSFARFLQATLEQIGFTFDGYRHRTVPNVELSYKLVGDWGHTIVLFHFGHVWIEVLPSPECL